MFKKSKPFFCKKEFWLNLLLGSPCPKCGSRESTRYLGCTKCFENNMREAGKEIERAKREARIEEMKEAIIRANLIIKQKDAPSDTNEEK